MSLLNQRKGIEILESRIAPAYSNSNFIAAVLGGGVLLEAGTSHAGLSTGDGGSGSWLLYVEKGSAIVFTSDLNQNGKIDYNEITGIAAGDGLRLTAFCDINGDIVTNLKKDGTLSDSDNNSSNDDANLKGDGLKLLDSKIEKIDLRQLTTTDLSDQNGDGTVDASDLALRTVLATHSIHGNVFAGGGLGVSGDLTSGLFISSSGTGLSAKPSIGSVKVGTAASGEFFRFSISGYDDVAGYLKPFKPATGEVGASIYNVQGGTTAAPIAFNLGSLVAGDGGFGAAGGNIGNLLIPGDTAGGYKLIAGNGGDGFNGGVGGSVTGIKDLGSVTSEVKVFAGNGGRGITGAGGNGGNVELLQFNVNAKVEILLGSGGDGLTAGGNGASLSAANIVVPEGGTPVATNIRSSYHALGTLDDSQTVDFDGDGIGDFVYTSTDPGQLVVVLGQGLGQAALVDGDNTRFYLDCEDKPTAFTIGDFNGDGHPDIAAASVSATGSGVINVYLSHYVDTDGNGKLDTFTGFETARTSMLPTLASYRGNFDSVYEVQDFQVFSLVAADLNGDGIMDLGVLANYTQQITGSVRNVMMVLHGDNEATGAVTFEATKSSNLGTATANTTSATFYADFGSATSSQPFVSFKSNTAGVLKGAALSTGGKEALFLGHSGDKEFFTVSESSGILFTTKVDLSKVDTDRDIADQGKSKITATDATLLDFTMGDFDADGNMDFAVLTKTPAEYLVTYQGDGSVGGLTIASGTGNQAGIKLSGDKSDAGIADGREIQRIVTVTGADSGADIALYAQGGDSVARVYELDLTEQVDNPLPGGTNGDFDNADLVATETFSFNVSATTAFDVYRWDATDNSQTGYSVISTEESTGDVIMDFTGENLFGFASTTELGIQVFAGHGGDSIVGKGGVGGSVGAGIVNGLPTFSLQLPANEEYGAQFLGGGKFANIELFAGDGGAGYTSGGQGGSIGGFKMTYATGVDLLTSSAALFAGDGGNSLAGKAGDGGSLFGNQITTGDYYFAGNGGNGKTGGNGGNVAGAGVGLFDTINTGASVTAGNGGTGTKQGGAGGSITAFSASFSLGTAGDGQNFDLTAGHGGQSFGGKGGAGGSIVDSSPSSLTNNARGAFNLTAGDGGSGITGGNGGSITNFVNSPTAGSNPRAFVALAGAGGTGVTGAGGNGGDVTNVSVTARAYNTTSGTPLFNRVVAGDGGDSYGGVGGSGGAISSVSSNAVRGASFAAAGEAGSGLVRGGVGGSISSLDINSAANPQDTPPKVVVIAGAGGDAYAFTRVEDTKLADALPLYSSYTDAQKSDAISMLTFGGTDGTGGDGGNIRDLTQKGSVSTRVDLIAGNGGSTINYGTAFDSNVKVGKGGSLSNITLEGSVGNGDPSVAIGTYGGKGTVVGDFVRDVKEGFYQSLDDSTGNVGLIAGASGRVYNDQPATYGVNGSVSGLTARNIMSMVAGSVESIASIQAISGVKITLANGDRGSDKDTVGLYDYILRDGTVVSTSVPTGPDLGGQLIDGAIVAKSAPKAVDPVTGKPIDLTGTRVFVL